MKNDSNKMIDEKYYYLNEKNEEILLVCPITKGPLKYDEANSELISEKANLAFPIEDGIPIMLIDKARNIK